MSKNLPNSGQALLLVVVSMAVVVAVVLSIAARSITDIRVTSQEEEALRAFSAAEAGIEEGLVTPISPSSSGTTITENTDLTSASFTANVTKFAERQSEFIYPKDFLSGDSATIWYMSHDNNNNLSCSGGLPCFRGSQVRFCWGKQGSSNGSAQTPAVEITIAYDPNSNGDLSDLATAVATFDPYSSRPGGNGFGQTSAGSCTVAGQQFPFQGVVRFSDLSVPPTGLVYSKVKFLYNTSEPQVLGVSVTGSGNTLPSQGRRIESTGTSGGASRKVEVFSLYPESPGIFDSALFSTNGSIVK